MRLAGIERGGFYPYPPHLAEVEAPRAESFLVDPCCGEGEIASLLGRLLNSETWGCELFPYRAERAATLGDLITCEEGGPPTRGAYNSSKKSLHLTKAW